MRFLSFAKLVVILSLSILGWDTAAQNYNQMPQHIRANAFWAFGDENGLDFSEGAPVHVPTALAPQVTLLGESAAAVADPYTGNLLFYTSGIMVWDRDHVLMPNGTGLNGNINGTTRQGVCIVPVPGDQEKYYIFSLGSLQSDTSGLFYSIVDMSLNGGNGDVLPDAKNIPVGPDYIFTEAMIAIPGNQCNVWLLTHEYKDPADGGSKNYLAFEITADGVNPVPVTSQGMCDTSGSLNYLAVSSDRSKVALMDFSSGMSAVLGIPACEVVRFNPNTGMVADPVPLVPESTWDSSSLENISLNHYSLAEFSPSGSLLYIIQESTAPQPILDVLLQFDLTDWDSLSINSSLAVIDTLPLPPQSYGASLKPYKDSLYVFYANSTVIGRVNQPDLIGVACDFQPDAVSLPFPPYKTGAVGGNLLEVVYPFSDASQVLLDTAVCGDFLLHPGFHNNDFDYVWNDGSTDTVLSIHAPGTYWVSYHHFSDNCIHSYTDTFKIHSGPVNIFPEITVAVDTLGTASSYVTYQWMLNGALIAGATGSTYVVTENGHYQVIVSDENSCSDTSEIYVVTNQTGIQTWVNNMDVHVYPNPVIDVLHIDTEAVFTYSLFALDGRVISSGAGGATISLASLSPGMYLLKLFDNKGRFAYGTKITKL